MTTTTPPATDHLAYTLPDAAYFYIAGELDRTLPPPPTPQERTCRNNAAIAQVAAAQPGNSMELQVATRSVLAAEYANHCLQDSINPQTPPEQVLKCRAQAASMMRQADSAVRLLLRLRAVRKKTEANPQEYDRGERIEHITGVLMTQALAPTPVAAPADPPEEAHEGPAPASPPDSPQVPPGDPESQNITTETPVRQTNRGTAPSPHRTISRHDTKSPTKKIETPERRPMPEWLRRPDPDAFPIDPTLLYPPGATPD